MDIYGLSICDIYKYHSYVLGFGLACLHGAGGTPTGGGIHRREGEFTSQLALGLMVTSSLKSSQMHTAFEDVRGSGVDVRGSGVDVRG
eukprot:6057740-Pyramimonas_sp.AAC.1